MAIPNTTQTPNIIFNGLMKKMTDTELRVVLMVVRATFGWIEDKETGMRKEEDWISHYQLKAKTGRQSGALSKAIDGCIKKDWIEARDKEGNLLDTKGKRKGKNIFYRIGKKILITTSSENKEVKVSTSSETANAKTANAESEDTKEILYKRNTIQNNPKGLAYGNPAINQILEYLKSKAGWIDGSVKSQRYGCKTFMSRVGKLIKEMGGEINDKNIIDGCKRVIDLAAADKFHSKNFGRVKYLYDNLGTIVRSSQAKTSIAKIR